MENNCFITTYYCSVDNDNLEIFNTLKLHVLVDESTSVDRRRFSITDTLNPIRIVCPQGAYISKSSDFGNPSNIVYWEAVSPNAREFYLLEGEYDIIIYNKYEIQGLSASASVEEDSPVIIDLENLKYVSNLNILSIPFSSHVYGDIKYLPNTIAEINFTSNYSLQSNVTGSIESLSSRPLTRMRLYRCTNIEGELTNFCNAMAQWRTSGTLITDLRETKVKYNGNSISSVLVITFDPTLPNGYSITTQS